VCGAMQSARTRSGPVGQGVVRATNQFVELSRVRFVLKMEQSRGKLYYILTAFPEL
jgi:Bacterial CdiA-CT RNAse A domain